MDVKSSFFEGYRGTVSKIIGEAVLELITEGGEISRRSVAHMVEVLHIEDDNVAADLALDLLMSKK
ncbi:hypothetical protein ABW09_11975 [Pluralibacter gergoviae]|uniref:hypothetical protein n=1 Tax=Pluralibacter gergoviae TaxID=61647 RepID=UPI000652319E|nr:hypothetical protein [Pluralibacter gergoviae]KMK17758.1 hypothetical protein ABW09_11975 [Pluralibacter gergoviae]